MNFITKIYRKKTYLSILPIILFLILPNIIFSQSSKILVDDKSAIIDMVYLNDIIYFCTDNGNIQQYNIKSKKTKVICQFPSIVDFFGDSIPAVVHSMDVIDDNTIIAAVQGKRGFRDLFIIKDGIIKKHLDAEKDKLLISRVFATNDHSFVINTLGNEILKFDIRSNKMIFREDVNFSTYTISCIGPEKKFVYVADESGTISQINLSSGDVVKQKEVHLDYVYTAQITGDKLITGSKDKRLAITSLETLNAGFINNGFPVYTLGVDSKGINIAYLYNEENGIKLQNINDKKSTIIIEKQASMINEILFINDDEFISCSMDGKIKLWKK